MQCTICASEYRDVVEKLAAEGMSVRKIAKFLNERGLKVHFSTIARHLKLHALHEQLETVLPEKVKLGEEEVKKEIDRIRALQENIERCSQLRLVLHEKIREALEQNKNLSYTMTNFYASLTAEIRLNIALLHEILSGPPEIALTLQRVYEELGSDTEESAS